MSELIASCHHTLVVGLGLTGISVARYLYRKGRSFSAIDVNPSAEVLNVFATEFPDVNVITGEFQFSDWNEISQIILSPGVPRSSLGIVDAIKFGVPVCGDVELFVAEAKAPIVAITGSNGKTTVTTLVGEMAKKSGINVRIGGNIGVPCLDLLDEGVELYVLELSSFQLESVSRLGAEVACVLNLSPDHMDRYESYQQYHFSKQRIYFGAKKIVANKDDALTQPALATSTTLVQFGSAEPDLKDYGLRNVSGQVFLAHGLKNLMPVSELKIRGTHNQLNALAALAIGNGAGLSDESMVEAIQGFSGLAHRCQLVARINNVEYYNDSKATNIGATLAAVYGFTENIVLIAGGVGKGQDFSSFGADLPGNIKAVILIGTDASKIASSCHQHVQCFFADSLVAAVSQASEIALGGDVVLLSPACASFDMFKNYQERGQQFSDAVEVLCQV